MTIALRSSAFENNQPIPREYTADGSDVSPPLEWQNVPAETKELALVCDDPDAPGRSPWVHWLLYKIPGNVRALPKNVPPGARLKDPAGALQGRNSWTSGRTIGYRGPAPPSGTHRYRFHLYALDAALPLHEGLDKAALLSAIKGHVIGEGLLVGTYRRQ